MTYNVTVTGRYVLCYKNFNGAFLCKNNLTKSCISVFVFLSRVIYVKYIIYVTNLYPIEF